MPTQITDALTIQHEKQIIRDVAGLSKTDEIVFNDRGWDSRVYSFGQGRYFFKFPRSPKIQNGYKYEIAAIKFLHDLDTKVVGQKLLWEHPENAYFGYEGVQGQPVVNVMSTLTTSQKQAIGEALGDFLKQFHALQLSGARTMRLEDESKQIQRWYEGCKPTIQKWFTEGEQRRLHGLVYEEWPAKLVELGQELVLSHGDLHFENILYGENGSVGIIDFGDVAYYDCSKDFLELEEEPAIFKSVLAVYGGHGDTLGQKIAVRQAMIQIINLGFQAGKNDESSVAQTVEKIKARLRV